MSVDVLLGFTRALRAAGVPVTQDRAQSYLAAVACLGAGTSAGTRAAGRATLCSSPEDLARHDLVFDAWFAADEPGRRATRPATRRTPLDLAEDTEAGEPGEAAALRASASATEVLRHRDIADLTPAERQRLARLFGGLPVRLPRRSTARHVSHRRGQIDASRTLRASLRHLGEPARIHRRRAGTRPRRVVLLLDVSGSMSGYADALLRLAHRLTAATGSTTGVETFTLGTRVTHLTRAMRTRDPEQALLAAGDTVPDWSGGTRLGETLRAFMDRWGRRGMARGAVVLIVSDGWERGDPAQLREQMARLHRLAHRVIWVNPHRGKPGYEPVQGGIRAVLPHVDDFLAGHTLATYTDLLGVIADA
ncbi:vWA domain-containing protein [Nocardioides limicola]|uniref:vWA domain-containing protein n=1 Tax=Nocardioides limicola TaxID=2803368 RepID=UPI00193C1C62|nr:VWA domain-containing protein [Nocardioides sp. DJM-14]